MAETRLLLVCGLPGAGKTTVARVLAEERSAIHLTKDEWLWAIGSTPWDDDTRLRLEAQLWRLAQDILRVGTDVVLDFGLWARVERDELRTAARELGVGVELHVVDAPIDELWRRIDERNSHPPWNVAPITRANLDQWSARFEPPDASELALFDLPPAGA